MERAGQQTGVEGLSSAREEVAKGPDRAAMTMGLESRECQRRSWLARESLTLSREDRRSPGTSSVETIDCRAEGRFQPDEIPAVPQLGAIKDAK